MKCLHSTYQKGDRSQQVTKKGRFSRAAAATGRAPAWNALLGAVSTFLFVAERKWRRSEHAARFEFSNGGFSAFFFPS